MFKNRSFAECKDFYSGLALTVFGAAYLMFVPMITSDIELSFGGSRLFPMIAGIGMIVIGLILAIGTFFKLKNTPVEAADAQSLQKKNMAGVDVFLTFLYFFCYSMLLQTLGFLICAFVYLLLMITLLAPRGKKKPIAKYAVIALVADVSVYLLFVKVFELILPRGILPF